MKPFLAFDKPVMSDSEHDVVRLVVIDKKNCGQTCPQLRSNDGTHRCRAFKLRLTNDPFGNPKRCETCVYQTWGAITSNEKAEKAIRRYCDLKSRKADMTKVAKKENTEPKPNANDLKETRKDTRHLKVILTPEELEQRADLSSHIWAEHCATETEAKTIASNFKSKVAELRGKHDTLQREIRDKCTYKDVECEIEFNYETRKVTVRRGDTGAIVEERDMLSEEFTIWKAKRKQTKLPFKEDSREEPVLESHESVNKEEETLEEESDRTASELKARAKKSKRNA